MQMHLRQAGRGGESGGQEDVAAKLGQRPAVYYRSQLVAGTNNQLLRISLAWSRLAMHDVSHQKAGVEEASEELNFFNYTRRII